MTKPDPVALAQALIRCRSVTPDEGGALSFLQSVLEPAGVVCHRFEPQVTHGGYTRSFHLTRNPVLAETFERLNTRVFATRYRSNLTTERWDQAVAEHADMLKLLEARNGPALRALLETHLHNKRRTLMAELASRPQNAAA